MNACVALIVTMIQCTAELVTNVSRMVTKTWIRRETVLASKLEVPQTIGGCWCYKVHAYQAYKVYGMLM